MTLVRTALANIRYPSNPDESVTLAESTIADAALTGATIVCFPEVFVPGYRIPEKSQPPTDTGFLEAAWSRIRRAVARAQIGVILGTERFVDGEARITALVFNPDGTRAGFQDKVQLDPTEETLYSPGTERHLFQIGDLRFGVSICHEGFRYPETVRILARQGAHVVFHPHYSWPEPDGYRPATFADPKNSFHEKAVLCRAAENTCYVASVNYAEQGAPTTSVVARPDGTVLAWQAYNTEGLLVVDIDTAEATGLLASRCRSPVDGELSSRYDQSVTSLGAR